MSDPIALRVLVCVALTVSPATSPAVARAQSSAATVTINAFLDVALTTGSVRDIVFPSAAPGASTTVAAANVAGCTGCTSGMWELLNLVRSNAVNRRYVDITFTQLPASLPRTGGGATLAVSYVARTCLVDRVGTEYYCAPQWTPAVGVVHGARVNPDPAGQVGRRDMRIYLGGTISPTTTQRAGYYNGGITITFAYGAT